MEEIVVCDMAEVKTIMEQVWKSQKAMLSKRQILRLPLNLTPLL